MCATVVRESVQRPTLHPSCAAAYAASTPACPAPMTITSNRISPGARLLSDTKTLEDVLEDVLASASADDFVEAGARRLKISEDEFFRRLACRSCPMRRGETRMRLFQQSDVARIGDGRRVAKRFR